MKIVRLKSIDSTHLYALRLIEHDKLHFDKKNGDGVMQWIAIAADEQTNGIGKGGRFWISERGNLFTSIIIKFSEKTPDLGQTSLTIACAVRETVVQYISSAPKKQKLFLHWPNDVYYENRKVSGILLAISGNFLIVSVGINVNFPFVANADNLANIKRLPVSICEIEKGRGELHLDDVLCTLLKKIEEWISLLNNSGFSEIRSYWLRNINDINCGVAVKNGNAVLEGTFSDIDEYGRAVIKQENGELLLISSGDLFIN